jgi:hypothetical protein
MCLGRAGIALGTGWPHARVVSSRGHLAASQGHAAASTRTHAWPWPRLVTLGRHDRVGRAGAGPSGYAAPSHLPRAIGHAPLAGAQRAGRGTASRARRAWHPRKRTDRGRERRGGRRKKIGMLTSTIAVRTGCRSSEAGELRRATVFEARVWCDLWEGTVK